MRYIKRFWCVCRFGWASGCLLCARAWFVSGHLGGGTYDAIEDVSDWDLDVEET